MGVESAHKMEEAAETGGRMIESAYHSHAETLPGGRQSREKLEKGINALYHKSLRDNPQLASNPLSRWQQKHAIKNSMPLPSVQARPRAAPPKLRKQAAKTAKTAAKKSEQAAQFVWRHRRVPGGHRPGGDVLFPAQYHVLLFHDV